VEGLRANPTDIICIKLLVKCWGISCLILWESDAVYTAQCACACLRARVCACVCACVCVFGSVTKSDRPCLPREGRGSGWRARRDSGHRDGRERRELLGRAEERLRGAEEPGGPLQRPALRGQERTRWAPPPPPLTHTHIHTHTHTHTHTHNERTAHWL